MVDSLVVGNTIELLGGGVASAHELCAGAVFRLAPGFDLSSPQVTEGTVAPLLLGGGVPVGQHIENRKPVLPIVILVPATGDPIADQQTLAGAREVLAQAVSADHWSMVWTREGANPMVFDCFHATAVIRAYSVLADRQLQSRVEVQFEALPYGRSDDVEALPFNSPSTGWAPPPTSVVIDAYGTVSSTTDTAQWSRSTAQVAVGSASARWSRVNHGHPLYSRTLPGPVNIAGRSKLSLWVGLGSNTYSSWRTGRVTTQVVLTDVNGATVTCSITAKMRSSGLAAAPRWQKISGAIPQVTTFDYTQVTAYSVRLWNKTENCGTVLVLQAETYLDTLRADAASTGTPGARGAVYAIPGAIGTAPAPLSLQLQPGPSVGPTTQTFTTPGSNNWTPAAGTTVVTVAEAWAAGSGGAGAGSDGGGGGAGGEYSAEFNIPVTPATQYHPFVGAAGTAGNTSTHTSGAGGDSYFTGDSGKQVYAHGGQPAGVSSYRAGGQAGRGSVNSIHYDGGDGKTIDSGATRGGGGGGSAGTSAPGRDAATGPYNEWTAASAVDGGGPGGNGGHDPLTPHTGTVPQSGPGGGGGGGAHSGGTSYAGAAGKAGQVRLTYASTMGAPLKTAILHLPPRDVTPSVAPMIAAGNGSDVPNGATTYTAPVTGSLPGRYRGTYQAILVASAWNTPANARTVTVTVIQHKADGSTASVPLARTLTPNTDQDPLKPLTGLVSLGTVTLPLAAIAPGNNTDHFDFTVNDTNTSDRFYDLLLLSTEGQTVIYATTGTGVNSLWLSEPEIGLDVGDVYGSAADWDTASSVLADCPVMSGGPLALLPGENPLLVYSVQGAPAILASYQPRWYLDRLA